MHKRLVNHCTIELTLIPDGPILIKSGKEGANPTKPDMEFVETYYADGRSIYLPGSSLKGAIRAHAERIVRTVGSDHKPENNQGIWANDPLNDDYNYLKDKKDKQKKLPSYELYKESSFTDQIFGNTAIASRFRIEDAYPVDPKKLKIEERNGVAIDRVFGSAVSGALFNYQVCTSGDFRTKIHLKNFTLAQLGLIGLVLRDLHEGWFGIGFAKSRGMGLVKVRLDSAVVQYPGCIIDKATDKICHLGSLRTWDKRTLLGVSQFFNPDDKQQKEEQKKYGYDKVKKDIQADLPVAAKGTKLGFGVQLTWTGDEQVKDLFIKAVKSWSALLGVAA
ncbi:MAG: CRISPR-associated RAMP protein Csx7 [Cyanophyceae cyanobacterium]